MRQSDRDDDFDHAGMPDARKYCDGSAERPFKFGGDRGSGRVAGVEPYLDAGSIE